jgi:hypothetical protein
MISTDILEQMAALRYEPTRLQGYLMGLVEDVFEGEVLLTDPSLPFPFLMESSVILTAGAIQRDEVLSSRQFPNMAKTDEDLYHHLTDADFSKMFGSAGEAWFYIYLSKEEILANAVQVGTTRTRKLTIPRHTSITTNGLTFTMQYPINFIVKAHGGIDVVYDASIVSPLQTLRGNRVEVDTVKLRSVTDGQKPIEFMRLRIKLKQMKLTSYVASLTQSTSLKKVYELSDNYLFTRAFYQRADGKWEPMQTTHSQQVFDALKPTLLLKVIGNELTVELPYVYYLSGAVTRNIRVDVYTTKGEINMNLGNLDPKAFQADYLDLDNDDAGRYSAPLEIMSTISIMSTDTASGGTAAPTFLERRDRMLNNATGPQVIPISNAQMDTTLEDLGFNASMYMDDVSIRTYLASKAMPNNVGGQASTGIDTAVMTMKTTLEDISNLETVIVNGDRYTITPKTMYRNMDGVLTILNDAQRKQLSLMSGEQLVNAIAGKNFLFTPLHYVLDATENRFVVRPYYLSDPSFDLTSYSSSNDTLGLTITSSNTRSIRQTDAGYVIQIQTESNDVWKALPDDQCHVQIAYMPKFESNYAYLKGTQIGKSASGERIYEFVIGTNWDIDAQHQLTTRSFQMFDDTPRNFQLSLEVDLMLLWSVSDYTVVGAEASDVDSFLGRFQLPYEVLGVYHENIGLKFGDELTGLWAMSRGMVGDRKPLVYEADVPARYPSAVYVIDPATDRPKVITGPDGKRTLEVKYAKGELEKNEDGTQRMRYFKGEAQMDEYGNVIYEGERNLIRWWDVCLFDAVYRYSSDVLDVKYLRTVPAILVEWINDLLAPIRTSVLDRTLLYFQPLNSLKHIDVLVEDGEDRVIYAAQDLKIDYYVSKQVYEDSGLRTALQDSAIAAVIKGLDKVQVSRNGLETDIKSTAGADVISVRVSGLGGLENDFNVITIKDESARMSVAKTLGIRPDNTISVIDSIKVNFLRHTES